MCPLIESNWFCHLFECWKYNNPGFIGGLKFKFFQGLTVPADFPAAELSRELVRNFSADFSKPWKHVCQCVAHVGTEREDFWLLVSYCRNGLFRQSLTTMVHWCYNILLLLLWTDSQKKMKLRLRTKKIIGSKRLFFVEFS